MATIVLYADKLNQMSGLIQDVKKSVLNYRAELSALKNKSLKINQSICNMEDVVSSIQASSQTQEEKAASLEAVQQNSEQFIEDTARIDSEVADVIRQRKNNFYEQYNYLKPECEKSGWEKFCDGCKKAGEWCREHWKEILAVAVIVIGIVLCFVPGLNWLGSGILLGALKGAFSGGIIGGLSSWASGGSFWEGFKEGAVTGVIFGGAFGALGAAGELLGNTKALALLGNGQWAQKSCQLISKIRMVSKISSAITFIFGGFDTLALGSKILWGDNWLSDFNTTLHKSAIYNLAQITIAGIAVFSGGMNKGFNNAAEQAGVKPTCFVAGTMILTATGLSAIEHIKAGDRVISTNPETGETTEKKVLEIYRRKTDRLIHLTVNGEEVITTANHPFYVKGRGFVNAGDLWVGSRLLDTKGNFLSLEDMRQELVEESVTVYNFQVEEFHTYHVGKNKILVHNAGNNYGEPPELPEFDGKKTRGVLRTSDGTEIEFESGGSPAYKNASASHAEGKAAIYMRENGIDEGTIFHNNPNGTCNYCDKGLSTLLPEGATLTVVPPENAVAPNKYWIDVPKTYIGNGNAPTMK